MKRSVLVDLVEDQKHFATRVKILWAALVCVVWIVSAGVVISLIPADWHRWQRGNVAFFWAAGAIAVVVVTGVVASRRIREHARGNGLSCGECQRPLTGGLGQKAVDSGQCPNCGAPMIDDETT